jgi:hypothetical protein
MIAAARRSLVALVLASVPVSPALLAASAGLAAPMIALAQNAPRDAASPDLPIRGITLYRSGVGCFERKGLVDGNKTIQLRFATEQINDILKSMVIMVDAAKGHVGSVGYGSKEPLSKRLESFGINIADNPPMREILSRLRGTEVALRTPEGEVSGTILNVEDRVTVLTTGANATQTPINLPWINLMTEGGVRAVNLTQLLGFRILDKALDAELNKALAAIAEHRADRVKTVDVSFTGEGSFPAMIAYVHEMPMWKTSYRLMLPEPTAKSEGGSPTIQGWALVENTTDEDWNNVKLSLVSGRPVSFQMDLYEPLHVGRPMVPVPMVAGVLPKLYQSAQEFERTKELSAAADMRRDALLARSTGRSRKAADAPAPAAAAFNGYAERDDDGGSMSPPQAAASGIEIGEVFQYQLKEPVSLPRQRSAMLPILSSALEGRRVSIFNRADNSEYPMRGVEFKNTSGLQLMPGPISVYDGSSYAGDAQIGHVSTSETRLLSYAVDLDVHAIVKDDSTSSLRRVRIVDGLIETSLQERTSVAYAFSNKDSSRPRTLLVEHAKPGSDWTLVSDAKPKEETQTLYRFEVPMDAGKKATLTFAFERVNAQRVEFANYTLEVLESYAKAGKVSQGVMDAFRKASALRGAAEDTQKAIAQLDAERTSIEQDHGRLRQNMNSVGRDTELYRRYTTKLNDQETRLDQIRSQREQQTQTLTKQQADLTAYLRNLNVE